MTAQRFFQAAAIAAALGLVFLSLTPRPPQVLIANFRDLVLHFGAYFALAGLVTLAAFGGRNRLPYVLIVLPVLGFGLEIGQIPVPGRGFQWADALANTVGAASGAMVATGLHSIFARLLKATG